MIGQPQPRVSWSPELPLLEVCLSGTDRQPRLMTIKMILRPVCDVNNHIKRTDALSVCSCSRNLIHYYYRRDCQHRSNTLAFQPSYHPLCQVRLRCKTWKRLRMKAPQQFASAGPTRLKMTPGSTHRMITPPPPWFSTALPLSRLPPTGSH